MIPSELTGVFRASFLLLSANWKEQGNPMSGVWWSVAHWRTFSPPWSNFMSIMKLLYPLFPIRGHYTWEPSIWLLAPTLLPWKSWLPFLIPTIFFSPGLDLMPVPVPSSRIDLLLAYWGWNMMCVRILLLHLCYLLCLDPLPVDCSPDVARVTLLAFEFAKRLQVSNYVPSQVTPGSAPHWEFSFVLIALGSGILPPNCCNSQL